MKINDININNIKTDRYKIYPITSIQELRNNLQNRKQTNEFEDVLKLAEEKEKSKKH